MSNLGDYHHRDEPPDKTRTIVAGILIAVILAGGAGYALHTGMFSSHAPQPEKPYPRGL
jgi:hypothetical protein